MKWPAVSASEVTTLRHYRNWILLFVIIAGRRYPGYRYGPESPMEYRHYTPYHWEQLCIRLLFIIVFMVIALSSVDCAWLLVLFGFRLLFITHVDERQSSRVSKAFSGVCEWFCLSVCLSVRTIKPKWLRQKNRQTWHSGSPSRYLVHQLILGLKVKGQGHMVIKCKNTLKATVLKQLKLQSPNLPHGLS